MDIYNDIPGNWFCMYNLEIFFGLPCKFHAFRSLKNQWRKNMLKAMLACHVSWLACLKSTGCLQKHYSAQMGAHHSKLQNHIVWITCKRFPQLTFFHTNIFVSACMVLLLAMVLVSACTSWFLLCWPGPTIVWANVHVAPDPWPLALLAGGKFSWLLKPNPWWAPWIGAVLGPIAGSGCHQLGKVNGSGWACAISPIWSPILVTCGAMSLWELVLALHSCWCLITLHCISHGFSAGTI